MAKIKQVPFDEEEAELISSLENEEWVSDPQFTRQKWEKMASESLKKTAKVNLRLAPNDLTAIKAKAARAGLAYQTYIGMILHKHVTGQDL
ncbi:MAG: antitoxin [Proteobacteria bacterium]|nr:antitoxin [Pseudomonadota bacterium]